MFIKSLKFLSLILMMFFSSCEKPVNVNEDLIGKWQINTSKVNNDGTVVYAYSKVAKLKELPGFIFSEKGSFEVWSSGWCGTPPVIFDLYPGKYQRMGNQILLKTDDFFYNNKRMVIIELTADKIEFQLKD